MRPDLPDDYFATRNSVGKLRSSPTGRVPQWSRDEAAGHFRPPVPFRGPTGPPADGGNPAGGRARYLAVALALVAVSAGAYVLRTPLTSAQSPVARSAATAARQAPPPGREEARAPLGSPPPTRGDAEGVGFRLLRHQDEAGAPVAWSPCRPVHYVVRPDNAPSNGAQTLTAAIATVSQATGLRFINDGRTTEGPTEDRQPYQPARYGDRWAPVLIAWASSSEVPDFGVDIVGEAGAIAVGTPGGDKTYISGALYLDAQKMAALGASGNGVLAEVVVLHELGHLVGLAHVDDRNQVMYARSGAALSGYGQGDRAGLAALGRGACQPDI